MNWRSGMRHLQIIAGVWTAFALLAAERSFTQTSQPNEKAIAERHGLPGLDEGFIPQGLTSLNGDVLLAGYIWPLPGPNSCRVYRLDKAGRTTGVQDIPAACSHGGGLAVASSRLFLADTRRLIELDPQKLFGPADPVKRVWPLAKPLEGSFLAGRAGEIWIGNYATKGSATIWRLRLSELDRQDESKPLAASASSFSINIPHRTQGAAFAPDGSLWLSQSGQSFGQLTRHNAATGAELARYPAPTGIEDIEFDDEGRLWASSETGSRRWNKAKSPFPFIYRIDTGVLRP